MRLVTALLLLSTAGVTWFGTSVWWHRNTIPACYAELMITPAPNLFQLRGEDVRVGCPYRDKASYLQARLDERNYHKAAILTCMCEY